MKRVLTILPILMGLAFLSIFAYAARERALKGQNDFASFYVGGKLAATGDLYSREANQRAIQDVLGFPMVGTTFVRPPYYAVLLRPLSALPYRAAYLIFVLAIVASILAFVIYFSRECPSLPFYAAFGIPFIVPLCNGQDTPFLLIFIAATIILLRRNMDFAAGAVFALCSLKPHLFIFVPIVLLMKKRWSMLAGGLCGGVALFAIGIMGAGFSAIPAWIRTIRDPWISPDAENLPNLHGLVISLHWDPRTEIALALVVVAALIWIASQSANLELLLAVSIVCGLLTSFHSGNADDVLLFAVFVLTLSASASVPLRVISAMLVAPIVHLLAFAGSPYSTAVPLSLLAWVGIAAYSMWPAKSSYKLAALPTHTLAE